MENMLIMQKKFKRVQLFSACEHTHTCFIVLSKENSQSSKNKKKMCAAILPKMQTANEHWEKCPSLILTEIQLK